ncbi:hypothetical protein [Cuneatibacter caecimuris]|uniref:HEAT repeat protein n=1 Tax=Cuneatibacter caecimuris TaxID=1796618 RepID=A0A4Q7PJI9_9FIRM|nr:hypothetical protein [Cuneatibacter caecimuris]RZT00861.1 hypothetical protein EV209_1294 [Cuneatibacter caecimuris]
MKKNDKMRLHMLLEEFWNWFGYTKEEYAQMNMQFDPGEFMFPKWEELIKNIKYYISQGTDDEDIIDDILTVMALDNESENVLDDIVENANDEFCLKIIEKGVNHIQHEARWQVAEIILHRKPDNAIRWLDELMLDKDDYVKKRAENAKDLYDEVL